MRNIFVDPLRLIGARLSIVHFRSHFKSRNRLYMLRVNIHFGGGSALSLCTYATTTTMPAAYESCLH